MRNSAARGSITDQQERFARAPSVDVQRSTFDRSFNHRSTFDEGQLIPYFVDEILPGDTVELDSTIVVRMATPKFPIMSQLFLQTHFFFVPNRILYGSWKGLQGEQLDPDVDVSSFVTPRVTAPVGGWLEGSIADYMGIPPGVEKPLNALPFRAYNAIYNAWLRDQDLIDSATVNTLSGPDAAAWYPIRYRAKKHDYFTAARPWPLKGGVDVTIPLGTSAPVAYTATHPNDLSAYDTILDSYEKLGTPTSIVQTSSISGLEANRLFVDLSQASSATLNDLRLAFTMQQALELDGRSGTRYVEALAARWKVTSPDFRLQRPEYIGGGRQAINVTQVPQTSKATSGSVGDLGGFGYSAGDQHRASYTATEHGILMGLVSIIGDNEYQEGIHKMWDRSTRWDYYEPVFANLGEQVVTKGELYADGTATDDEVWGYQERWAEYRYKPSVISGAFRSTAAAPLHGWHTAEELGSVPPLAEDFISTSSESPNVGRCLVTPNEPHFLFDSMNRYRHTRVMPVYSVPGLTRL